MFHEERGLNLSDLLRIARPDNSSLTYEAMIDPNFFVNDSADAEHALDEAEHTTRSQVFSQAHHRPKL